MLSQCSDITRPPLPFPCRPIEMHFVAVCTSEVALRNSAQTTCLPAAVPFYFLDLDDMTGAWQDHLPPPVTALTTHRGCHPFSHAAYTSFHPSSVCCPLGPSQTHPHASISLCRAAGGSEGVSQCGGRWNGWPLPGWLAGRCSCKYWNKALASKPTRPLMFWARHAGTMKSSFPSPSPSKWTDGTEHAGWLNNGSICSMGKLARERQIWQLPLV